jgi:hypothetical protein
LYIYKNEEKIKRGIDWDNLKEYEKDPLKFLQ